MPEVTGMIKVIEYKLDEKNIEKTAKEIALKIISSIEPLQEEVMQKKYAPKKIWVHILVQHFIDEKIPVAGFLSFLTLENWRQHQIEKARKHHKRIPHYHIEDVELMDM
jgi:hypothetical protein